MNREDVIRMAREAGFVAETVCFRDTSFPSWLQVRHDGPNGCLRELELFAAMVAAAEREACAQVCDRLAAEVDKYPSECAAAIRARNEP